MGAAGRGAYIVIVLGGQLTMGLVVLGGSVAVGPVMIVGQRSCGARNLRGPDVSGGL